MKWKLVICLLIVAFAMIKLSCRGKATNGSMNKDAISYNFDVRPILSDKCFACHGPDANKREAGLRLDVADSAFAPLKETKNAFAIIRGDAKNSEIYKRICSDDPAYIMPVPDSHLGKLSSEEIEVIKKWIDQGAKYEKHWAFTAPQKVALPEVSEKEWCKNEIDYFVLNRMEKAGLHPNEKADNSQLLKRLSFDITGMLPDETQLEAFTKNNTEVDYEKQIASFFASKHYGEKLGLLWLDVSRYSDSYGYQDDGFRTQWPFRDWVIRAFNKNMPYDQFIKWQLAGDLLSDVDKEKILATAFLRNHKYTEEGGVIPEEYRVEYIIDKVKTFTKGVLGITLECAQCHDHKYDPFSQKEYYQMFAFFNNSNEIGYEGDIDSGEGYAKLPKLDITPEDVQGVLSYIKMTDTSKKLSVSVMDERKDSVRTTFLLKRGVYDQHGDSVNPGVPTAIMPFDGKQYPRNRLGLADWTINKKNPLTARVFVNLMWQEIFGRGLIKTTGDFGMQGELPSHPQLLDWLALDFMEHNWNIQHLLKKIFLSSTYRQSAKITQDQIKKDPENIYLSRASRQRIKAEFVKDIVMQSSGLLNNEIGGPSVKPYQPFGLWETASSGRGNLKEYKQDHGANLYRRGMYTFIKLTVPPASMMMFDASNRDQCEVKRVKTNTPLQALIMMNDPMVLEASRVFAQSLLIKNANADSNIETAFKRILCRQPAAKEKELLLGYFTRQYNSLQQKRINAEEILNVGEYKQIKTADRNKEAALMQTISLIYNMEEAITKT